MWCRVGAGGVVAWTGCFVLEYFALGYFALAGGTMPFILRYSTI